VFLTNDFTLPAVTTAQLYKARWQVELFFKWIKQHLRLRHLGQRREDPSLGGHQRLCAGGDPQEPADTPAELLHNHSLRGFVADLPLRGASFRDVPRRAAWSNAAPGSPGVLQPLHHEDEADDDQAQEQDHGQPA
jgi:hypothetical protein